PQRVGIRFLAWIVSRETGQRRKGFVHQNTTSQKQSRQCAPDGCAFSPSREQLPRGILKANASQTRRGRSCNCSGAQSGTNLVSRAPNQRGLQRERVFTPRPGSDQTSGGKTAKTSRQVGVPACSEQEHESE